MIIDGTGDDFKKIAMEKKELEEVGYDCYMIFVNTTLEVALERNENAVVNVYSLTSSPAQPQTYILVPSLLNVKP